MYVTYTLFKMRYLRGGRFIDIFETRSSLLWRDRDNVKRRRDNEVFVPVLLFQ